MRAIANLAVGSIGLLLSGCGSSGVVTPTPTPTPIPVPTPGSGVAFGGKVFAGPLAGGQPIVGASVQLYAAGTTGNGSLATALLATPVTTDSTGSFSVAATTYSCPAATSVLLLVATGGHVGTNAANGAIQLVGSPGACSTITTGASYVLNELTTVASAYAFNPFLSSSGGVSTSLSFGSTSTNASGILLAAGTFANLANGTSGLAPGAGFPSTGSAPNAKLDSVANALNACVISSGTGSTACSSLGSFGSATTFLSAQAIARNPGANVGPLYTLTMASAAYSPVLGAAPPDWMLTATYLGGGMNAPSGISIDGNGRVWVANYYGVASLFANTGTPVFATGITGQGLGDSYGGAVDASNNFWVPNQPDSKFGSHSTVTELSAAGTAVAGSPYTAGGINYPISVAFDATGIAWVVDYGDSHVTLLNAAGAPQSGTSGYDGVQNGVGNFDFPVAIAVDGNRNGWVANQSSNTVTRVAPDGSSYASFTVGAGPSGIAVDAANNVWSANFYALPKGSVGVVSAAGAVVSGAGFAPASLNQPQAVALDGAGTAWVPSYRGPGLTEFAGVGSAAGVGTVLSPAAGWAPDAAPQEAFAAAIDAAGSLWVTSFGSNALIEYIGVATPVKTPLAGPVRVP